MGIVSGKNALVTGAGGGIGRATARKFSAEGANVVVSDIDGKNGVDTVRLIRADGSKAVFIQADCSKPEDVDALIKGAAEEFGSLDCVCNNAGIEGEIAPFAEQTIENYDAIMNINARGMFLCLRAEIREMLTSGGGAIVNLASIAGLIGFSGIAPYTASKHAVNGLTKNAAVEYGKDGIRVNSICPGGIDTRMLDSLAEQATGGVQTSQEMMAPLHPIGRIGTADEVAELIVFLCSDRASFITGANIPIDGGFVAQ